MFSGLPPSIFPDAFELEQHAQDSLNSPDPFIYWMQRLECVMSRALSTLMQNRYEAEVVGGSHPVQAMISLFDTEVLKIKRESQSHLGMLSNTVAFLLGAE